jgi:excisionase family DNA binding protein
MMTETPIERLSLRPAEAAQTIGISLRSLRRLLADGTIPSFTVAGRTRLIRMRDLREWLDGLGE